MKELLLKHGEIALVDDEDYDRCRVLRWYVIHRTANTEYVANSVRVSPTKTRITYLSRFIMGVTDKKLVVDHINHNTMDNRKENLRVCSHRQNLQNQRRVKSSKYPGVSRHGNKWFVCLHKSGKLEYIGLFTDEREAAKAYEAEVRELGEELVCKMHRKVAAA